MEPSHHYNQIITQIQLLQNILGGLESQIINSNQISGNQNQNTKLFRSKDVNDEKYILFEDKTNYISENSKNNNKISKLNESCNENYNKFENSIVKKEHDSESCHNNKNNYFQTPARVKKNLKPCHIGYGDNMLFQDDGRFKNLKSQNINNNDLTNEKSENVSKKVDIGQFKKQKKISLDSINAFFRSIKDLNFDPRRLPLIQQCNTKKDHQISIQNPNEKAKVRRVPMIYKTFVEINRQILTNFLFYYQKFGNIDADNVLNVLRKYENYPNIENSNELDKGLDQEDRETKIYQDSFQVNKNVKKETDFMPIVKEESEKVYFKLKKQFKYQLKIDIHKINKILNSIKDLNFDPRRLPLIQKSNTKQSYQLKTKNLDGKVIVKKIPNDSNNFSEVNRQILKNFLFYQDRFGVVDTENVKNILSQFENNDCNYNSVEFEKLNEQNRIKNQLKDEKSDNDV